MPTPKGSRRPEAANVVYDVITGHASVRAFEPRPIPETFVTDLVEVFRRAPTSSALQAYTVLVVDDSALKAKLRPLAGGQPFLEECPLFFLACADLRRYRRAAARSGYPFRAGDLRSLITATEDIAIGLQNVSLLAQASGYGTVMVGGVLNGAREIAELFGLPRRIVPLLGLSIGVPASAPDAPAPEPRPRLPTGITFHRNRFEGDEDRERALLDRHDQEATATPFYRGRRIPYAALGLDDKDDRVPDGAYGWQEHVARKQARTWWIAANAKLREDLEALGVKI